MGMEAEEALVEDVMISVVSTPLEVDLSPPLSADVVDWSWMLAMLISLVVFAVSTFVFKDFGAGAVTSEAEDVMGVV